MPNTKKKRRKNVELSCKVWESLATQIAENVGQVAGPVPQRNSGPRLGAHQNFEFELCAIAVDDQRMKVIEVENLHKEFERSKRAPTFGARLKNAFRFSNEKNIFHAVQGVNFSVEKGESLAFIGPNGAGKSTTIKMLTGLLQSTSGRIQVLGMDPARERIPLAYRIGSVFGQKSQLWLHLPPRDTFELLSRIYKLDRARYNKRRQVLVDLFDLGEIQDVATRKLSLGQRMRCEVAASLLHEPEIIFLDEPTIGLDPVAKASIRDLIKRANKEEGVTVFLTSHDSGDIERLCQRVIIINHGKVIFDDNTQKLRRDYLTTKEISLKLTTEWTDDFVISGVKVIKAKGYGVKLSVDQSVNSIDKVVGQILARGGVEDITIQNQALEEVITQIYQAQPGR